MTNTKITVKAEIKIPLEQCPHVTMVGCFHPGPALWQHHVTRLFVKWHVERPLWRWWTRPTCVDPWPLLQLPHGRCHLTKWLLHHLEKVHVTREGFFLVTYQRSLLQPLAERVIWQRDIAQPKATCQKVSLPQTLGLVLRGR